MRTKVEHKSESDISISDPSQLFEPREDDDETLYEVIEITGERVGKYRVRWKGNDPKTRKPWPQSWVPKTDCTDDLVMAWKKKKKNSKKNGRESTTSKRTSRSLASTGTKSRSESTATSANATKRRDESSPSPGPSVVKSKPRHRINEDKLETVDERNSIPAQQKGPSNVTRPTNSPTPDVQPKGKKRKLVEVQSAISSANPISSRRIEAIPIEVGSDEGQETRITGSKPPRKKRKIATEAERTSAQPVSPQEEKSDRANDGEEGDTPAGAVAKGHSPNDDEERMLGDALPAGMNELNDGFRNDDDNVDDGKRHSEDRTRDHPPQEAGGAGSGDVEVIEMSHQPQSNAASKIRVKPPKRPIPRMMPQPPPNWIARSSGKQTAISARVPDSSPKAINTTQLAATKKLRNSSFVAQSNTNPKPRDLRPVLERDSDTFPPLNRHRKSQRPKPATKPLQNEHADVISILDSEDSERRISLSPRARQRLATFDMEVMGKKTQVEKKRTKEVHNDAGETSTSKSPSSSGNGQPATSTVRPALHFGPPSYLIDVVPETELENSQEDKLPTPPAAVRSHEERKIAAAVSLIDSSTPAGPSITKSLRSLPQISPSTFHPHLQPFISSLPDSIIEPSSSLERNAEIEAIEQFDSPARDHSDFPLKKVVVLNKNGVVVPAAKKGEPIVDKRQSAEEVWDSEIVRRGQEIAEQVEGRRRQVSTPSEADWPLGTTRKKSIQEVVAHVQSRSHSEASRLDEDDEGQQREEEGVADASTSVVPPASGPPALSQDQLPENDLSEPRGDDLVDLSMDVDDTEAVDQTHNEIEASADLNPEALRQEEEESSQDIMAELRQHEEREINPEEGLKLVPLPVATLSPHPALTNPVITTELASCPSRSHSLQKENQDDDPQRGPLTRLRSRSKTPSVLPVLTSNRVYARGKGKSLSVAPVPSRSESAEVESQVDVFQNTQGASATSSILAAQISSLQTQVAEKQLKIDSFQQDLDRLRELLKSSEDQKALLEADRERQLDELRSRWASDKLTWDGERGTLAAQNAQSENLKIQAEQDREFIREQYATASAYVTTVREENKELEKRLEIAENQSKKGVELIKATFESQVSKLQDDAKAWRRMAEFVMEKDMRTNDDVRRRAAEEPELRVLCARQKKSLKEARTKIEGLQTDLQEKIALGNGAGDELEHWKKENTRLQSDLNEALIKLDRLGRSGDEISQGDGHEFVYRCMWRAETENSQSVCPEVFATMRELEEHIYSGHLPRH